MAVPLTLGGQSPVGVLGLYRREVGAVSAGEVGVTAAVARAVALALVCLGDDAYTGPGGDLASPLGGGLDAAGDGGARGAGASRWRGAEQTVQQAVGRMIARGGLSPGDALARLRAHAFARGETLDGVAGAVAAGNLRLDT